MSEEYERIVIKFRDVCDVVNPERETSMTFMTRMFLKGDLKDENLAWAELTKRARKWGFTDDETLWVKRISERIPI